MHSSAVVCWLGILRLDIHESFVNTVACCEKNTVRLLLLKEIEIYSPHQNITLLFFMHYLHGVVLDLFYQPFYPYFGRLEGPMSSVEDQYTEKDSKR